MTKSRRIKWQSILPWSLALVVIVITGWLCLKLLHKPDEQASEESAALVPVSVRTARAETRTLIPTIEIIGVVEPDPERYSILSASTTGIIDKFAVREGTHVNKNDLVIQLNPRPAQIALDRAEAAYARLIADPLPEELTQARLTVEKADSAHALAESRLKKAQDLHAHNAELVPELELQDEKRNEEATKAEWETAQAQLRLLQQGPRDEVRRESHIEVEAAKMQLDFCQVRAPIAGDVVEIKTVVGQHADVGTPLVTILDSSEVLVRARIPSDHLAGVLAVMHTGDDESLATIHNLSFGNESFPARGGWLSEQTEAQTSDVPIKLRVPNPKGLLRAGMTVRVELHEQGFKGVAIPEAAITVNEEGHHVVTLIRDGKAVPTEVSIASDNEPEIRASGWVRILDGLQAGDEVAIENGYALPKDTPVQVLPPAAPDHTDHPPAAKSNNDEHP